MITLRTSWSYQKIKILIMIGRHPNKSTHHNTISMQIERILSLSFLEWCLIRLLRTIQGQPETSSTERVHRLTRKVCEITFKGMMKSFLTIHRLLNACLCLRLVHKLMNLASVIFQEKVQERCKHVHNDTLHRITVRTSRIVVNINRHQLSHCLLNNHHLKDHLQHKKKSNEPMIT